MAKVSFLKTDEVLEIPADVAVCPICGGRLYAQFEEWIQNKNGEWKLCESGLHLDCENEPDIDSDDWLAWHQGHYSMPYVDWLPVEIKVVGWINENYVFEWTEDLLLR